MLIQCTRQCESFTGSPSAAPIGRAAANGSAGTALRITAHNMPASWLLACRRL